MSKKAKIIIIIIASLAVLVVAFLLIQPGKKQGGLQNTVQNLFPFGQPKSPDNGGTSTSTLGNGSQLTPITDETTQTSNGGQTTGSGNIGSGSQGTGSSVTTEQTSFTIPSLTNPSGTNTNPQVGATGTPAATTPTGTSNGGLNAAPASDLANRPTTNLSTSTGINCYSRLGNTCFNKIEAAMYFAKQEIAEIDTVITLLRGNASVQGMADKLMKLDQCIPGPDYGYEKRLRNLLDNNDEWKQIGNNGQSIFDIRKKAGVNLELNDVINNIRTEMSFRTKNLPMAQDGLAFIDATQKYNDVLRDYRDRRLQKVRTLASLENLNLQWKAAKAANNLEDQQKVTAMFANFGQDLPTQSSWYEVTNTRQNIEADVKSIDALQVRCTNERNTYASTFSSQRTYIGSRVTQPVTNIVNADNSKKLFCSVDPYWVNTVSREIDCRPFSLTGPAHDENGDDLCAGDAPDSQMNSDPQWHDITIDHGPAETFITILRRHTSEININFVRDDEGGAGGQAYFNDHPDDVLVDDHIGLTAHNLFSLGISCDSFYKSSRYDYLDELIQYGF